MNSGTEACMTAIRLARGYTQRKLIVKYTGCYHGHVDSLLVSAGSGCATTGQPSSKGVPDAYTDLTLVLPYNDLEATQAAFAAHGSDIAGIIVEPIAGNMGLIKPVLGFLAGLRDLDTYNSVLIFDEVKTGFRFTLIVPRPIQHHARPHLFR